MKSQKKFLVSNICHNEFNIYIRKFTIVKHFGLNSLLRNINNNWHV